MSYEKAMNHSIQKSRKQANNHFGFDTGSGVFKQSTKGRTLICQGMEVQRWFADRHNGDRQRKRECIRDAIVRLRELKNNF